MIDLSYLTEEEQEMILSVLKRDAELKHKEEQRIKKLQKTERDEQKLKYLTGEWFYETKSNRHRDKIHGSDIVRASMSRRKPVTIMELTQIWPRKSSHLKSESKDIFIPPELSGLIGESSSSAHDNRDDHYEVAEYRSSSHPQTKPRPNPFNSRPFGSESPVKTEGHLQTRVQQNLHQVSADQQPVEESKPYHAPKILAEDHHEDLAEPRSSQVSEPFDSLVQQGKVNQTSTEGQSHTLTVEDESPVNKVLAWVGLVSRYRGKSNKSPDFQEEEDREGPDGHGTPDAENAPRIHPETSTLFRMGLPGLFLRESTRVETSEKVLDEVKADDVCRRDDKQGNINSGLNCTTVEFQGNSKSISMIEKEIESLHQGEVSENRLASLVSFWESRSKETKVLKEKSETDDNKLSEQKIPRVTFNLSPSKANKLEYTDIFESCKSFSESYKGTRHDDNISVLPSVGEKMSSYDTGHLPTKQMDDIPECKRKEMYSPVLSVRKSINEQDAISDPKTCWERENRELSEIKTSSKGKLNPISRKVSFNSPLADTDGTPYNRSLFRTRTLGSGDRITFSPVSYPLRNFTTDSQDHIDQSTGDTVTIQEQSRTLRSRHVNEFKKSRIAGCPLRVFPIDINPSKIQSNPGKDDILLAGRPEEHLLSFAGNTSERITHYRPTSPHSPPCFGRSQAPGVFCLSKQTRQAHYLPVSQSQTSPEPTNKPPVVLTEQTQLDDLQCRTTSSMHLSCQHHKSTHVSGFTHQPHQHERAGVLVNESSERMSLSHPSQPQSEITFSSSTSTGSCSLFQTSSACGSEAPAPIRTAQNQPSIRPLSISKSLEDLATLPSNERWKNDARSGIIQTVEEAPHSLSIAVLDPEQTKRLSVSVPAFIHEQDNSRESDCLSVNSFYSERQRKSSINTNTSASSGLASMSSVSGSVTNIYGTDFGNLEVKGTIRFAMDYVNKLGEFHIFIVQCRDLAVAEPKRNRSDPYVKCYLLPDKAKLGKRKTSVKKKTLNPTYNEILRYKIPLESLRVHTLNISVWHNDMFGRNSFLGEVNMDLSDWDNNSHMIDCTLNGRNVTPNSPKHVSLNMEMCGDMRISLRFLLQTSESNKSPQTGEIQVWVKECTNLLSIRKPIDSFVKCSILPDSHQKKRQKTRAVKKTSNPVFNHTMVFEGIGPEDLRDTCVELTVWNHDRLSNHFLGGTRLNLGTGKSQGTEVKWMDSNSVESALWRRMIESTNQWVEETVPLRMLIMTKQ